MSEVKNPAIVYISPAELVVHPKLIEIYGENEERPALEKSISEKGILESLKVSARTGVNVVLAGKCRLQIAHKLISSVKVEFVESGSPEEDLKLVLDFNLHREGGKT
ncbi:MAG: ParB N-terminal domain-containing protein, partial [Nostoc sp.]